MIHHYEEECDDDDVEMWCEVCEDEICDCETLCSEERSEDEKPTESDEEFIAPEGDVTEEEDEEDEEEDWDFDEEDTDDSEYNPDDAE